MRVLIRLLAALCTLVIAAGGVLLAVEAFWGWIRPDAAGLLLPWPEIRRALGELSWDSVAVRVSAAVLAVVGLVLLLLVARAGRHDVRLHDPAPSVTVTTNPRSLARVVGHRVRQQDGVADAVVTAGRDRVRVRATGQFHEVGDLPDRLTQVAEATVRELPLSAPVQVSVSVTPARGR